MVGDWMGSIYGSGGRRDDLFLFLDHDGRYERTERAELGEQSQDKGVWEYDEAEQVLRLTPDATGGSDRAAEFWSVHSVSRCEDSNVMLVLRQVILASRNLPIILYRVHNSGRGYGTGWEQRHSQS